MSPPTDVAAPTRLTFVVAPGAAEKYPNLSPTAIDSLPLETSNRKVWGSGLAGVNRSFRFADVRDGLARTVIVDEVRAGVDPLDPRGVWALGQIGSSAMARHGSSDDAGSPNPYLGGADEMIGCRELIAKLGREQLDALSMGCEADAEANTQAGARSMHPGGVNLLFCDGSAHFVIDQIDPAVWHALHTRSGGENVEAFFLQP